MSENNNDSKYFHPADSNGDGHVSEEEHLLYLEFKRKELEDADAMRDAQRSMAWFSLWGMLLYPILVIGSNLIGYEKYMYCTMHYFIIIYIIHIKFLE